ASHCPVISTLSLHAALPILCLSSGPCRRFRSVLRRVLDPPRADARHGGVAAAPRTRGWCADDVGRRREAPRRRVRLVLLARPRLDRKSTRLNSSHVKISYAV